MNKLMLLAHIGVALLGLGVAAAAPTDKASGVPLGQLLRAAQQRTGIAFVVPPCLANDNVPNAIPVVPSPAGLGELLDGYNYSATWDTDGKLVKVVLSGRIGSPELACVAADGDQTALNAREMSPHHEQLLRYEPAPLEIPGRYRQMPPGTVSPVSLPIDLLNGMELGERLDMSLPDGQFGVILENRFDHDNGDVTWVGYLEGTDANDRVILTGGTSGTVGQVITPTASYGIEFEGGQSWLVDLGRRDSEPTPNPYIADSSTLP